MILCVEIMFFLWLCKLFGLMNDDNTGIHYSTTAFRILPDYLKIIQFYEHI